MLTATPGGYWFLGMLLHFTRYIFSQSPISAVGQLPWELVHGVVSGWYACDMFNPVLIHPEDILGRQFLRWGRGMRGRRDPARPGNLDD